MMRMMMIVRRVGYRAESDERESGYTDEAQCEMGCSDLEPLTVCAFRLVCFKSQHRMFSKSWSHYLRVDELWMYCLSLDMWHRSNGPLSSPSIQSLGHSTLAPFPPQRGENSSHSRPVLT